MSERVAIRFFSATPVFRRDEFARAVGRQGNDPVVDVMLAQHLKQGNIRRVARGVYASVPPHAEPQRWAVDRFLAASRMRSDSIVGYHSALELHGISYTVAPEVQVISAGRPGVVRAVELTVRFVRPKCPPASDAVVEIDRAGLRMRVTSLERTLVDVVDRWDLCGGHEEVIACLDMVEHVNTKALLAQTRALGRAKVAGTLGWWLEREQERLGVSEKALEELRTRRPKSPLYAFGARRGEGRLVKDWNVVLPEALFAVAFEGV